MNRITIKNEKELEAMAEGGAKLAVVKKKLKEAIKLGMSAAEIEKLANTEIAKSGGKSSFKRVEGYSWSTCINVNDGVVHGIPHKHVVFKDGDLVSVDVGLYYKGFHTDTSFTVLIGNDKKKQKFLEVGREALSRAIKQAKKGHKVGDISEVFETVLKSKGAEPIRSLTGHGVGKNLHEAPLIPCYVSGSPDERIELKLGMTLAIEAMYTNGTHHVKVDEDGWTIRTKDGKIAALFEETVAITENGPKVLTA